MKAKLVVSDEARQKLMFAMQEFNRDRNALSELAFERGSHRKYDIHHEGYDAKSMTISLDSQTITNLNLTPCDFCLFTCRENVPLLPCLNAIRGWRLSAG